MRDGVCVICGKHFAYEKGRKNTCGEVCRLERKRRYNRERERQRQQMIKKPEEKKVKRKSTIDNDVKEAKKRGLSYGQYIAMKEGR